MAVTTDRLRELRDVLLRGLIERDEAIRLALVAAISGEHLLLVGPPGTAKSLVARRLHLAFQDATYFERLLTRFTVPEELFGPLSIRGLEEDRYERLTQKYLPSSSIAFLDEIFKANSAILNSLLTLLNEREFDNGTERVPTPLVAVIGASNELPQDEELQALFDRFLLRLHVGPVSSDGFPALLKLRGQETPDLNDVLKLSREEVIQLQRAAESVKVPDDVLGLLCELRDWCVAEGIPVSDRRWRKIVKLLQTSALTNGSQEVSMWDCWLLQHCLWSAPEDRKKVQDWYERKVGTTAAMDSSKLTTVVVTWEGQLRADQASLTQMIDHEGRPVFLSYDGLKPASTDFWFHKSDHDGELLFLAPKNSYWAFNKAKPKPIDDRSDGGDGYTISQMDKYVQVFAVEGEFQSFAQWEGRAAYLKDHQNWLRDYSSKAPAMTPTKHKPIYVRDCLRQLHGLQDEARSYADRLQQRLDSTMTQVTRHLWIPPAFAENAVQTLQVNLDDVNGLIARLDAVAVGYQDLPQDEVATTQAPDDWQVSPDRLVMHVKRQG